jgi:hypothetical protein
MTIDLDAANRMMTNNQFVIGPSAENIVHHLHVAIDRLKRPGDQFELVDINVPYAWRNSWWPIFERLRERDRRPPEPVAVAASTQRANEDREWNQFVNNRVKFRYLIQRDGITEDQFAYLGLQPGDLDSPTSSDPKAMQFAGGKRLDWVEVAGRIAAAMRWEIMDNIEKRGIPTIMKARRLERRIADLESQNVQRPSNRTENGHVE